MLWLEILLTVGGVALMTWIAAIVEGGAYRRFSGAAVTQVRTWAGLKLVEDETPVTRR